MKKFFLILLINAPFLLNNTIKADTSQLFTLFDIRKENNVDNVSKLFLDMGFPAKEFYSGYDNTNFFNISFEQEDCHILLNYTPSNRYIFRYQVYKDSLNKNDYLDGPRQVLETLIKKYGLPDPYFDDTEYGESHDVDMQHLDPLFEDAARLIVMTQEGSTSLIQRKFAIGYNRAGRLMDQLEKAGIVGAAHGSRPREVLIMDEMSLENLLSQWRA